MPGRKNDWNIVVKRSNETEKGRNLPRSGGIADVLRNDLCVGCGACAAIEPGLEMQLDGMGKLVPSRIPGAEADHVCPFSDHAPDEDKIACEIGLGRLPKDDRLGHVDRTWAGHVVEGDFREKASSGGLATWLLVELLNKTRATSVVHVHADPKSSDRLFDFAVSHDADEVRANAKTRYYPVTFDDAIAEVRRAKKPFLFVGVPCHVKALNALCLLDPELADLLVARIAIFCGHLKTVNFANSLAMQAGISPKMLRSIDFRHKIAGRRASDYGISVESTDGSHVVRPMRDLVGQDWGKGYFRLKACNFCDDVVGETADISLGDAWLPQYVNDSGGTSIIVSRRQEYTAILEAGASAGRLMLDPISNDTVVTSQAAGFRDRRDGLRYRLWLAKRRGQWAPRKRVRPGYDHLSSARRIQLRLRGAISRRSHGAWRFAQRTWPRIFVLEGKVLSAIHLAAIKAGRRKKR